MPDEAKPVRLYRFELAFDGECQDVGLFDGIYETGLDQAHAERLLDAFADLPIPDVTESSEFWFTEAGVLKFKDRVADIVAAVEPHGWSVVTRVRTGTPERILYSDDYQVAVPRE